MSRNQTAGPGIDMPFFFGAGMSKRSQELRSKASRELRCSRNGSSPAEKIENKKRAAALKALSENEEWLDGEKQRPTRADKRGKDDMGFPKDDESKFG